MAFEKGTQMGTLKELRLLVQQREDSSGREGPTQGKAQPGSQQPMPDGAADTAGSPVSKNGNGSLSSLLYQMRRGRDWGRSGAVVIGETGKCLETRAMVNHSYKTSP